MSNTYFAFRQFGVHQERCAMKVSTDACIFGAWIPTDAQDRRILDIGTGTGLLALMLAQRNASCRIEGIELDAAAASQARENAADSIFADRIRIWQHDARSFQSDAPFDLIVSNPPFFANSLKGPDDARNAARHSDSLQLQDLFEVASRLLTDTGRLAILMQFEARSAVFERAQAMSLGCRAELVIRDKPESPPKRGCWVFSREYPTNPPTTHLHVRDALGYSDPFRLLLRPYYLSL